MTRMIGTGFQGVTIYDTEPEAPTKRSALRKIAEDEALIRDAVTGDNSPPLTLNHTGDAVAGQGGALLGVPCTQLIRNPEGNHALALAGLGLPKQAPKQSLYVVSKVAVPGATLALRELLVDGVEANGLMRL